MKQEKLSEKEPINKNYALKSIQKSILADVQPEVTGIDGLVNMQIMEKLEKQCL